MRFTDQLVMSMNNLRRRKLRTFLTILGVMIGSASIVIMVSLGIGLKEQNRELIESSGSLTTIQVQGDTDSASDGKKKPKHLTDEVIKKLGKLKHAKSVYPVLEVPAILRQGAYQASVTLKGVPYEYMEQLPLKEGRIWKPEQKQKSEIRLLYGSDLVRDFSNRKTGSDYWGTGKLPDVDLMKKQMFVIFDTERYYQAQSDVQVKPPKKYILKPMGIVDGEKGQGSRHAYSVLTEIEALKANLKQIYAGKPIPGQPVKGKKKAYPYLIYQTAEVNVDQVENVKDVQEKINEAGFQTDSNIEWLEQSEKQSGMIQAVLGGIGAVSLLVASIGIANTMMMSIYERTKEIGVLKVLGCDLGAIRNMFLMESGMIGFLGGVSGAVFSFGASYVLNRVLKIGESLSGQSGDMSRIPVWLFFSAIIFSILVGMAAGFFPALRAMKLSPLAAIRNE